MKILEWIKGLGRKKESPKVRHMERPPEPKFKLPASRSGHDGSKKGHARGAFGRPRGPFDPRPALSPDEMRAKYPRV